MPDSYITKVIILAAGLGTRMRREDQTASLSQEQSVAAASGIKALIPVGSGRPFLDYVLQEAVDAGYRKACLIIGPRHQAMRDYYQKVIQSQRLSITFAVQSDPLGTANALLCAEDFAAGDEFLMLNSDNLYPAAACAALRQLDGPGTVLFSQSTLIARSNIPRARILKFALGIAGPDGNLRRVVEKPDASVLESIQDEACVSMNCWRFGPAIFKACRSITPSSRGEYEITDAVQYAIDHLQSKFRVMRCDQPVLDLSSRSDIAPVAALLSARKVQL